MSDKAKPTSEQKVSDDVVKTDEELWSDFDAEAPSASEDEDSDPPDEDEGEETPDTDEAEGKDDEPPQDKADKTDGDGDDADGKSDDLDLDALQKQNERLEKQFRSEQSRSIGQQRRAERLQKRVNELEAKLATKDSKDGDDDEELEKLREDYPDVAGPILDRMKKFDSDKPDYDAALNDAKEELEDIEAEELAKFRAEHDDGFKVVADNPEAFREWIQDQPKQYRDIFERNRASLVDGTGAALLVSRFKGVLQAARQSDEVDEQSEAQDKLTTKREKQLSGATSQGSKVRSTKIVQDDPTSSDDPQAEWDYFDRLEKRKKA